MNKGAPTKHPLARIGAYGHPWHGVVHGGVLTLPGGATRAYPQPNSTYMWEAGAAHRMYAPGTPSVSRTVDEQTDDALKGYQWLDYAIQSGGNAQWYGNPLGYGRFVWVDSAGDRWLIDASSMHNVEWTEATVPSSVWINIQKFGEFNSTYTSRALEVSMPSLGQASPAVYAGGVERTSFKSSLYSIHPQGRSVAFMLHYQLAAGIPSGRWPCGWYELQLSGTGDSPGLNISVLHDRAATLGTADAGTITDTSGGFYQLWTKTTITSVPGDPYPTCGGSITFTTDALLTTDETAPAGYFPQWQYDSETRLKIETNHSTVRSRSWSGMVLAVWYDSTGDKITNTLDVNYSVNYSKTGTTGDQTGQRIVENNYVAGSGSCVSVENVIQEYALSVSTSSTATQSVTWTLKNNGITVSSKTVTVSGSASASLTVGSGSSDWWSMPTSANYSLSGAGWDGSAGSSGSRSDTFTDAIGWVASDYKADAGFSLSGVGQGGPGVRANALRSYTYNTYFAPDAQKRYRELIPSRLGHSLIGWLMSDTPESTGTTTWTVPVDAATPGGTALSSDWNSPGASYTSTVIFVTRHPVSGDLYVSTTPACYV